MITAVVKSSSVEFKVREATRVYLHTRVHFLRLFNNFSPSARFKSA
jgi:hypothetical protein